VTSESRAEHVGSADGLDDDVWARLMLVVQAANRADAHSYTGEIMGWGKNFPVPCQHRMGVYLMYLLSYTVKELLRRNSPTDEELHDVAVRSHSAVQNLLNQASVIQLEKTLRVAFNRAFVQSGVTPGEFMVLAGALVGVMVDDSELDEIRPRLAAWWQRNYADMRSQRLLD
jgi:hypothetical protein